jgi:NADH-quinone oxidoreductase subunit J
MVLVGALGVIFRKHPVHAALSLVLTLFGIAVLFVAQSAEFLAAVQVIVYAGAIFILFLFVIMLLGVDKAENLQIEPLTGQRWIAGVVGLGMVGLLTTAVVSGSDVLRLRGSGIADSVAGENADANIQQLASSIFSDYVFAFEVTSVLLVVAVVLFSIGAVGVLVRRNPLVMFMCIELMLNAVNLTFVTVGRAMSDIDGQAIVFFVMVVAAAEVVVGLGIIVSIMRRRTGVNVDDLTELKG